MSEQSFLAMVAATTLDVACGDETHRLMWATGELTALDHDDPEGERTLAALGGMKNGCVEVLDAWSRCRHELRALVLASRGPGDTVTSTEPAYGGAGLLLSPAAQPGLAPPAGKARIRLGSSMRRGWSAYGATAHAVVRGSFVGGPPQAEPEDDYSLLFALGGALGDRLAATVAAHWAERIERGDVDPAHRPALQAALAGRVWVAARSWLGDASADIDVRMIEPSEPPALDHDGDRWTLALPFRWVSRVW